MSGSYPCTVKQNVAFLYPQIHLILCLPPLLAVERQNCEKLLLMFIHPCDKTPVYLKLLQFQFYLIMCELLAKQTG